MTEEVNFQLDIASEQMQEAIMHLENVLAKIRAGKANPQMLRTVKVDYYGVSTPLAQTANVSTPDSQTITVQPFDQNLISEIEQAIVDANLGFAPSNNGEKIIINVPPLTEDRRKELAKQAKAEVENTKVSIRNVRQKANDEMRKLGKGGLSEDLVRGAEESVQELTNTYSEKIDAIYTVKEAEIMTV
jgi:ribosome recycling factor